MEICFGRGREHCGKQRNAFSPFPTIFTETF